MRACTFSNTRSLRLSAGRWRSFSDERVDRLAVEPDAERGVPEGPHLLQAQRADVDLADVTPSARIRALGVACVRPVVPKPGMVSALHPVARHAQRVERLAQRRAGRASSRGRRRRRSTTGGLPMCSSRLARPATWVWKISSQRSSQRGRVRRHERVRRRLPRSSFGSRGGALQVERQRAVLAQPQVGDAVGVVELFVWTRSCSRRSRSRSATSSCSPRRNRSRLGQHARRSRRSGSGRRRRGRWSIRRRRTTRRRRPRGTGPTGRRRAAGGSRPCRSPRCWPTGWRARSRPRAPGANSAAPASTGLRRSRRRATNPVMVRQSNSRSVPNGTLCPAQRTRRRSRRWRPGRRAGVVELLVVRQVRLRHDAEHLAPRGPPRRS